MRTVKLAVAAVALASTLGMAQPAIAAPTQHGTTVAQSTVRTDDGWGWRHRRFGRFGFGRFGFPIGFGGFGFGSPFGFGGFGGGFDFGCVVVGDVEVCPLG